jgi:hypothetical protein
MAAMIFNLVSYGIKFYLSRPEAPKQESESEPLKNKNKKNKKKKKIKFFKRRRT